MRPLRIAALFALQAALAASIDEYSGERRNGNGGDNSAGGGMTVNDGKDAAGDGCYGNESAEDQTEAAVPDIGTDDGALKSLSMIDLDLKKPNDAFRSSGYDLIVLIEDLRRRERSFKSGDGCLRGGRLRLMDCGRFRPAFGHAPVSVLYASMAMWKSKPRASQSSRNARRSAAAGSWCSL